MTQPVQKTFTAAEARRLRRHGQSLRTIAKYFGMSVATVYRRLRDAEEPRAEPAAIPMEKCQKTAGQTQAECKPVSRAAVDLIVSAKTPALPLPIPVDVPAVEGPKPIPEPMPTVYRAEFVPEGTEELFLVRGELNALYCQSYRPHVYAVGVDSWEPRLGKLPLFANAERVFVVISKDAENSQDNNTQFVRSLRADAALVPKCVVSNQDVRSTANWRYWSLRNAGPSLQFVKDQLNDTFLKVAHFRPLAEMEAAEIAKLCEWGDKPIQTDFGYQPSWTLGGSAASR